MQGTGLGSAATDKRGKGIDGGAERIGEDSGIQRVMCTPGHHMTSGPTTQNNGKSTAAEQPENATRTQHTKENHCYVRKKTCTMVT
jgi:hypothetical protein